MCEVLEPGEYFKIKQPQLSWDDIAGFKNAKERIEEMVALPLKHPEGFRRAGIKPHIGVLVWGPSTSGCGAFAEAAAKSAGTNFISAKAEDLLEGDGAVSALYSSAVELAPCVVFIGDIEILAPRREVASASGDGRWASTDLTRALFAAIDSVASRGDVITIAATPHPELLDPALLRNGRIDRKVYLPMPDYYDRLEILRAALKKTPLDEDSKLERLAELTEYYSSGDILSLAREATLLAIKDKKESFKCVELRHFKDAMARVPPSLEPATVRRSEEIYREECKHRYMY